MRAASSRPLFGVCVGEQMLFDWSEEGDTAGLGVLPVNAFLIRAREPVLVDTGLAALESEVETQILPDGGHIERSPAVMLDLLAVRAREEGLKITFEYFKHVLLPAVAV